MNIHHAYQTASTMKKLLLLLAAMPFMGQIFAQNKEDNAAIKSMCGCYKVVFEFAETFSPNAEYQKHKAHQSEGLEWVELVEDGKQKIVLQHLLIVDNKETGKQEIVKHWRQDWLYENTELFVFDKNNRWLYRPVSKQAVKGQWTQRVAQVDDSPRYEASATWVHSDQRHYWESTAPSPLPRREFTERSDYNVLQRRNRHEITAYGWLHEQDNAKIQVDEQGKSTVIAYEKGWNTYTKVDDAQCQTARDWWKTNASFWAVARQEWATLHARKKDLALHKTIDEKPLFMHLFALKPTETAQIKGIIARFVKE